MGSYGIGVSRAVAAIAEQSTTSSACAGRARSRRPTCTSSPPARTTRCAAPPSSSPTDLEDAGLRVIYDDRRQASPGVKFKDAELLGVPTIVVVGKGLADGVVEVKDRGTGERTELAVADALDLIVAACRA